MPRVGHDDDDDDDDDGVLCARTRILFNLTFTLVLVVALCVASRHALSSSNAHTPCAFTWTDDTDGHLMAK